MRVSNWSRILVAGGHGRLEDRANNFTAIRTAFALVVLLGHAIMIPMGLPITGVFPEIVDGMVQYALDGFFILSGYMIAASLLRSADMTHYTLARVFRIFPGLIAAALVLWLVVGPMFTTLSLAEYFTHPQSLAFPFLIILQGDPQASLPGVFAGHPLSDMNGPLWTIRFELLAYLAAGALASVGLFRNRCGIFAVFLAAAALSIFESIALYQGPGADTVYYAGRFGGAFMAGAALYALRDKIPLKPVIGLVLIGLAIALSSTPLAMISGQIAMAFATLWAGYLMIPGKAGKAIREVEDISYGIYILHWPIGQMAFALLPGLGATGLFAIMLPGALVSGWLMRVLVEKPAMALKPRRRKNQSVIPAAVPA
ncbi:MAG: acyltransferase [Hyphobacterium sp.]|nr:MAG: acyltransferase [Hyphobacterium sp.]